MNVVKWTGTAVLAFVAMGCGAATAPEAEIRIDLSSLPAEVVLRHGQEVHLNEDQVRLTFVQVLEDSRCPEVVTCVWEGNAKIQIGAASGMGPSDLLELSTALLPRSVVWQGLRITLLEVQPARQSETPPEAGDYSVRLRIELVN